MSKTIDLGRVVGPTGPGGKDGAAGTITSVTASVDNTSGNPQVKVTMGGTPNARIIDLGFTGLRGVDGKGAVSTVNGVRPDGEGNVALDVLEPADLSGRTASGTSPSFDGVFEGTEMAHVTLYGKSTQDGTPSPDAPVDIVDYAPDGVAVSGMDGVTTTYPLTLTLPGIPVDDGGNYTDENGQQWIADTYDVVTGEYVQRCKTLVLDGTEAWTLASTNAMTWFSFDKTGALSMGNAVVYPLLCNILTAKTVNAINGGEQGVAIGGANVGNPAYVTIRTEETQGDLEGFKAYLAAQYAAGTPVTVLYALAEPIVTYLDPRQVLAYSPTTNISAGGGYIQAKLGPAMAPVRTTPQELTQAQISQFKVNLDIPDRFREGRALPLTWAEVSQMCELGDYKGIREGDYIDIQVTGTFYDAAGDKDVSIDELARMEIAGIDSYYKYGDKMVLHCIDWISRDCLSPALMYNATATNAGSYVGSQLYTTLNGSRGIVLLLPADVAAVIITKRGSTETKTAADASGWAWNDMGKLWLPTELEVWGHVTWAEHKYGGGLSVHYPIFRHGLQHIIKGAGHGGGRSTWWCASSAAGSAANFCVVNATGRPNIVQATYAGTRVPLCFRVAGPSAQAQAE